MRNGARWRRLKLFGTRRTEERLSTDSGSTCGSAPLADLMIAWCGIDCDVARVQNISYQYGYTTINLKLKINNSDSIKLIDQLS